ncbi:MAG TPA: OmpA family protein, partial [Nitrospirota bacterium]|nr:OmpA family protein [Nitrospirota bacterium]
MNRSDRKYALYMMCLLLLGVFALWGCPKKSEVATAPETQREEAPVAAQAPVEAPAPAPAENPAPRVQEVQEKAAAAAPSLRPVYFDFDQALIRPDAKEILKANAEWMKAHPQAKIKIEGNRDERGTREYNQALGQRRAANAKKFMADLGV